MNKEVERYYLRYINKERVRFGSEKVMFIFTIETNQITIQLRNRIGFRDMILFHLARY